MRGVCFAMRARLAHGPWSPVYDRATGPAPHLICAGGLSCPWSSGRPSLAIASDRPNPPSPTIAVMAAALSALLLPRASAVRLAPRGRSAVSRLLCAAAAGEATLPSPAPRKLVLYTKPGCCLCDGLKEKLHAAVLLAGTPYSLASLELQERDITTDPEWERLYQYEIPVLAKVLPDGTEEKLPRLSPRLSVELVQKKISSAFDQ